jgi:HTH-type transcriptional regulator/antitoxin HigA
MKGYDFSKPRPIHNDKEYDVVAAEIDRLLDLNPARGTAEYDQLELLSLLIEAYDREYYSLDDVDVSPQAVVDFMLEQKGMSRADLIPLMGGKSRMYDFFAGKRGLSMSQVQALRQALGISADLLIPRTADA